MEHQQTILRIDVLPILVKKLQTVIAVDPGEVEREKVRGDLVVNRLEFSINYRHGFAETQSA